MTLHETIRHIGDQALSASRKMVNFSPRKKNAILNAMADALDQQRDLLKEANAQDLAQAMGSGLSAAMLDRLTLTDARIDNMIKGIREVSLLPDPVGKKIWKRTRPNGLVIEKKRVPLGVVAIIYESRPNVTADAAVLCIKTSNAVILRGGKEAIHSNLAIARALQEGGMAAGMPKHAVQIVETVDREAVRELVQMDDRVDVVIPRGGESLIRAVVENARVPVLKHYKGVCHVFVDATADLNKALAIVENAKCQRPGVCNAMETLLVHQAVAASFLPMLAELAARRKVELRGCKATRAFLPACKPATEEDWTTEYLDLILSVRTVKDLKAAIGHINTYSSHHSDAIVTSDPRSAKKFLKEVDSAAVYVNASTRFTDGGEFGMGAEMGISTDKLHARGPMGLEELTSYKYVVTGNGQIRS
ncbi:MAG TPA: glutamate-5-semialdehyde dehydrogenase [Kiritimatiellia bacterium]|nr:glutamate-5-semialdehyde dehydrogenase [Kiritimatiellia bacterium]HPS06178.1 glutamate-5-semialdehyde dehydrogenase [Kiritimatiellia bacterium]